MRCLRAFVSRTTFRFTQPSSFACANTSETVDRSFRGALLAELEKHWHSYGSGNEEPPTLELVAVWKDGPETRGQPEDSFVYNPMQKGRGPGSTVRAGPPSFLWIGSMDRPLGPRVDNPVGADFYTGSRPLFPHFSPLTTTGSVSIFEDARVLGVSQLTQPGTQVPAPRAVRRASRG